MLSKCEGIDVDLEEIKTNVTSTISHVKDIDSRIAFTGAIDGDTLGSYKTEIQTQYKESVLQLRRNLFKLIFDSSDPQPLPASVQQFFKNDIQQFAKNLKKELDDSRVKEKQRWVEIENQKRKIDNEDKRNKSLYPQSGTNVMIATDKGKYVCLNKDYLGFGEKKDACLFRVVLENKCKITLTSNGKIVHRSGVYGWVALWDGNNPLPLEIRPIDASSIYFKLFSKEDSLHIGYSSDNKFLQLDKGRTDVIFKWESC